MIYLFSAFLLELKLRNLINFGITQFAHFISGVCCIYHCAMGVFRYSRLTVFTSKLISFYFTFPFTLRLDGILSIWKGTIISFHHKRDYLRCLSLTQKQDQLISPKTSYQRKVDSVLFCKQRLQNTKELTLPTDTLLRCCWGITFADSP